ncbi:MAG: acylphosphatase [Anaerolineaceae bacterium]|nr:acylphosphatase [Anaerolineaceae bacterium]
MIRRRLIYRGTVQGVGFRWTARRLASGFEVTGTVRNCADGTVELVVEGAAAEVRAFCAAVRERMADYIHDTRVSESPATGEFASFEIGH